VADRSLHIAINVSAADITTGRVLGVIAVALERTNIRPQQIWLEATERGFIDVESAKTTIARARQLGYMVAIDDFGTGFSSLQYLQGLPIDVLKIDKSFVDTIGKNVATGSVISHIIDMARELNLQMVAEGVETEIQASYLLAHRVEFAQGWLYSKPLPAEEFIDFCRQATQRHAAARGLEQSATKGAMAIP
jgi:sensor c-di-GMP phosphodiesterase-like protein